MDEALSREERLAAKLRENLRRRKSQARDMNGEAGSAQTALPKDESER
ncbi:hypothetical protein [Qipengyuania spongiae]|uniref:DUF4169 family protein n=1 Tax=Qipengyuania spongiae TaxID=2909673 RepID=A0ABY5T3C8_9SPHN|nr:hypothetical protein [Qipengyuania spongiae]UVI40074.1 hypothetical protein L1F33_03705 [Qipengyuania spongiae]